MAHPFATSALPCLLISALLLMRTVFSESRPPVMCPHESAPFVCSLQHQCPISISPITPVQVDGDFLNRFLVTNNYNRHISIIFYASWCPFSQATYSAYEAVSSIFPQIDHLAVEQSSVMPSVFSRFGIHSVPAILLVNQTSRVRYCGPKTLISIAQFYEKNTGIEPDHLMLGQPKTHQTYEAPVMQLVSGLPMKEMVTREPYLVFSVVFLCLRMLWAVFPTVVSRLKTVLASYVPHFNLGIFGDTSQILGRVLPVVDLRRMWTKLRLCKTRNFHASARNARVWASSLASVSLGESSSARSSS